MKKLLPVLLSAIISSAQQSPQPTRAIYITATHRNVAITKLALSDLDVKGVRPVALQSLEDTPLWVAVLVDESGSAGRLAQKERIDGISEAMPIMLRSGTDVAMLVNFNDNYYLEQSGTTDVAVITRVLRAKADARGGSAVLDSVRAASDYLLHHPPTDLPRVIFLFSDCADNGSRSSIDQALQQLQRNGTRLYVFKEPADGHQITVERHGSEMLKMLAERTGGRVISIDYKKNSKHRIADAFKLIEPELRSWHRLYVEMPADSEAGRSAPFKIESSHSDFEVRSQTDVDFPREGTR